MVETTEKYHRIPVAKRKKDERIRTISIGKGIKALYDAKNKMVITYLFSTTKYTMKQAKDWVKRHKKSAAYMQIIENLVLAQELAEIYNEAKEEILNVLKE